MPVFEFFTPSPPFRRKPTMNAFLRAVWESSADLFFKVRGFSVGLRKSRRPKEQVCATRRWA
jgi:hypothetical protein